MSEIQTKWRVDCFQCGDNIHSEDTEKLAWKWLCMHEMVTGHIGSVERVQNVG